MFSFFHSEGFDAEKVFADVKLDGKVVFITGATSGLGFQTAESLVSLGATVYIAARNEDKAKACIKRIEDKLGESAKGRAVYHGLDLASPKGARESAKKFMERVDRLDVLINNAAEVHGNYEMGENGIQKLMNVNYFSPWILTHTLLELMRKTASLPAIDGTSGSDVRIINVTAIDSSSTQNQRFKNKDDFNFDHGDTFLQALKRYRISKLMVCLWTRKLQRELNSSDSNIICIYLHPGVVFTESAEVASKKFNWLLGKALLAISRLTFMTVVDGARTIEFAAVAPEVRRDAEKYKGKLLVPIAKLGTPSIEAMNDELGEELSDTTDRLMKEWNLL